MVIAEHNAGQVHRATWEAVALAQGLGQPVTVVVAGHDVAAVGTSLSAAQVAQVRVVEHAALANYTADGYVLALADVVECDLAVARARGPHLPGTGFHAQARDALRPRTGLGLRRHRA